ncbi:MAG TPA: hypothetical protein VLX85_09915 [Stellaceae bacterium]|nr:hypothetical protein [Stellaceae bacterium]
MARADAQHGSAGCQEVERGDCGGGNGRRSRFEIGNAKRDPGSLHTLGGERRRDPWIHGVAGRISDPDHVVAIAFGGIGHGSDHLDAVGPEEEADLHGCPPVRSAP